MKNTIKEKLYHYYIQHRHKIKSRRGSWMLSHLYLKDYRNNPVKKYFTIAKVHEKGWSYADWEIMDIAHKNKIDYLNTRDYCFLHPLNGEYSHWIDDKLTLKYLLEGTSFRENMPEYYMQILPNGEIVPLSDFSGEKRDIKVDELIALLKEKRSLALKKMRGALGEGFVKLSFEKEKNIIRWNDKEISEEDLNSRLKGLRNYLVMEFLTPHAEIARFCDSSLGSLRFLIGKGADGIWREITSFLRVGVKESGPVENYMQGGVVLYLEDGKFHRGHVIDDKTHKDKIIYSHPDNNLPLKGEVPLYDTIKKISYGIAHNFPQLKYLGFDFAITSDNKVKITEINSLNSLTFQIDQPVFKTPGGKFFREELAKYGKD
ncbi:MAG: hypothetical protein J1F12_04150 [Muribaculaceae bacterium]|nr:hypothetical protein [Muribaculaceae bacterium]